MDRSLWGGGVYMPRDMKPEADGHCYERFYGELIRLIQLDFIFNNLSVTLNYSTSMNTLLPYIVLPFKTYLYTAEYLTIMETHYDRSQWQSKYE